MKPIKHILVASDLEDASSRAVAMATELAERLSARLTLVHVVEPPPYPYPLTTAEDLRVAASRDLEAMVQSIRPRVADVAAVVREGTPWEEIGRAATELRADLIVSGTHGRRGLPRILIGSVAEQLIRQSAAPVLAVRPWSFESREAAGRELGESLERLRGSYPLVLSLSRNAVVIGAAVARALSCPSGLLLCMPYEHGGKVVGAVCEQGSIEIDPAAPLDAATRASVSDQIARVADQALDLRGRKLDADVAERTVLLVTDCLLTPWTSLAAAKAVRRAGAYRVVVASPIGSPEAIKRLEGQVDEVVVLDELEAHMAADSGYRDSSEPSLATVRGHLRASLPPLRRPPPAPRASRH